MTRIEVPAAGTIGIRAPNPGPFTLTGTNSWIVGADPAWLIDPGPALAAHLDALESELRGRGGLGGIALTHDHGDHAEAVAPMQERFPGTAVAAARGQVDIVLGDGDPFGPLRAVLTPGHAPDHLSYVRGDVAFTGDAVLGEGSVFVAPYPGALRGYLDGLERLRGHGPALLCPGHGPPVLEAGAKLDQYIAHRLERERMLLKALDAGARTVTELLDRVWSEAPVSLRRAATWTLAAHLDKLESEGRLPDGVERPAMGPELSA